MTQQLTEYLEDKPGDARSILEKASTAARAREAAKKARDLVIRKNAMEGGALPESWQIVQKRIQRKVNYSLLRVIQLEVLLSKGEIDISKLFCHYVEKFLMLKRLAQTKC